MTASALSRSLPRVICYADTDVVHSSYATTAFVELAHSGAIDLRFRLRDRSVPGTRGPFTLWTRIAVPGRPEQRVCFDFHDANTYVCEVSLAAADVYYKANFSPASLEAAGALADRLRPFGAYTPCRPTKDRALPLRVVGNSLAHLRKRLFLSGVKKSLREKVWEFLFYARRIRGYRRRKVWTAYEAPPAVVAASSADGTASGSGPLVFFNPSCWHESTPAIREVNRFRAEVIVGLREALGELFEGGFRRSALAESSYPEALERRHYSHDEYVRFVKSAPISVYTNGLSECISWRFIEIFAASRCIVSEPVPNEVGFALEEGHGIVQAPTPEALVAEVLALRDDPARVTAMRHHSWQTYVSGLRPAVRMGQVLAELGR